MLLHPSFQANHATNMHAPLHWLNNRLSRVCAGAPYLSTNTSSHRRTSGNVFLRSQCNWKIDVAFACTRNFPLNAMRFSQIRMERGGMGANVMGMCVLTYISFQLSPPSALLLWFQMDFHFPFLSCSLHCDDYERNETKRVFLMADKARVMRLFIT